MGGGQHQYRMLVSSPDPELELNLLTFGPFELELDPAAFFEEFFEEIDRLPRKTKAERDVADRRVAARAPTCRTLMPDELRQTLWGVRDRISSIIVQSEEPWIPWSSAAWSGARAGRSSRGRSCARPTPSRWLPGVGFKRPLSLRKIAVVVPDDSGRHSPCRSATSSCRWPGRAARSPRYPRHSPRCRTRSPDGTFDGWHFTGHGAARDANGQVRDGPPRRRAARGDGERERHERQGLAPVVFINACQVGRSGMALTGIGGWANRFVECGAGAFIGAYWSVFDEPAYLFAREVYAPLDGKPIGQAVRDARLAIGRPATRPGSRTPSSRIRWRRSAPESRMDRPEQPTGDVA